MLHTADSDDNWAAMSIFFLAALRDTADVTGCQNERSTGTIGLDVVVILLFVPSLWRDVQTHLLECQACRK